MLYGVDVEFQLLIPNDVEGGLLLAEGFDADKQKKFTDKMADLSGVPMDDAELGLRFETALQFTVDDAAFLGTPNSTATFESGIAALLGVPPKDVKVVELNKEVKVSVNSVPGCPACGRT